MTDEILKCLNALVQADPDAAEMTLLRKSRLAPNVAKDLPFHVTPGYRGDAEITPLNILNSCLKAAGQQPIGYKFNGDTGHIQSFLPKFELANEEMLKQYEGEFLKLTHNDNGVATVAHRKDALILKVAKDRWDVYSGVDTETFRELVLSKDPDKTMLEQLKDRPYKRVKEVPK